MEPGGEKSSYLINGPRSLTQIKHSFCSSPLVFIYLPPHVPQISIGLLLTTSFTSGLIDLPFLMASSLVARRSGSLQNAFILSEVLSILRKYIINEQTQSFRTAFVCISYD